MPRTFLNLNPQNRLRGDPRGGARTHPGRPERSAALSRRGSADQGGDTMGLWPEAERGPRRAGHARQRRGETGEEVRRQVRGRKAPSWGGGYHVPELVLDSPSAGPRVRPGSSPILPDRPLEPVPDPPGAGLCSGAHRAAQDKSLSSQLGYTRLYRLGGAPISGDARDRAPGPALRSALLPAAVPEPWPWPRRGAPARSQSLD